jgi:dTDP-3-amino-3,4,6-trideoxy-alpha-D-glucose transaminase
MQQSVPLVDLNAQYASIRPEIDAAIQSVIDRSAFIMGPDVRDFEARFADYCAASFAVGVASGTAALELTLRAYGIGAGDEVITSAHTFIATAEAISAVGARPVFVEIDPQTYNLDPDAVAAALTPATRALIPVHIYGQPADMDRLMHIAQVYDLPVIEDAAQAHGATWRGRRVGTLGHAACFSFYPGKNLGAYGDAGAVTTDDAHIAEQVGLLRNHGRHSKYLHDIKGFGERIDTLQAAILAVKLRYLENCGRQRGAGWLCATRNCWPILRARLCCPLSIRRPIPSGICMSSARNSVTHSSLPEPARHRCGHSLPDAAALAARLRRPGLYARRLADHRGSRRHLS